MSNQLFSGSICVNSLLEKLKQKHSSFVKGNNGKIYCNISIWLNDEEDKFGNSMSFQLQSKKEQREIEGKVYIGNAKLFEKQEPKPISDKDIEKTLQDVSDDLPF